MLWTPEHGLRPSYAQTELIHTIRRCGLTSGLKLCLDAGDANSYSGSGQSWLDTSGNGYDFFRGANGSAAADDPTYNGTAGQRASTNYWSFDGGDFFRYDSANETWMNNLHKDNAKFTLLAWVYVGASPAIASGLCGTSDGATGEGVLVHWDQALQTKLIVRNLSGGLVLAFAGGNLPSAAWTFLAVSLDEAVGTNGAIIILNASATIGASTYASPTANNAVSVMEIGARGSVGYPMQNADRLGMFAAWEGVALTQTQLNALYQTTRGRYGV